MARGGEALARLLTPDEGVRCGSLEGSSAPSMVSPDFPFCAGENPFLWHLRLPSAKHRHRQGAGRGREAWQPPSLSLSSPQGGFRMECSLWGRQQCMLHPSAPRQDFALLPL